MKVSDCCGCAWYAADGWPTCERCDRVCALEDSIARAMRMGALAAKKEQA